MRTAALVYAGSLSPYALRPIGSGKSAYERCIDFTQALPGLERALIAEGATKLPESPIPKRFRESWTIDALFEALAEVGEGMDAVFVFWADEPFLDAGLAARMLEDFRRYRAEYGFADGYPLGLATEILSPRILPALRSLAASLGPELSRDSIFSVIQKDINSFDIETEISPADLRDLRLVLACDTKRNTILVERLMEVGVQDAASALAIIPNSLTLLRTLPSFVQIQVHGACLQSCSLCPYPAVVGEPRGRGDYMPRERFASLIAQVHSLCEDATIDISLWGEPSLHPDIGSLVEDVLSRPGFSLIIETSGLGWDRSSVASFATRYGDRLKWIVSLDAATAELYARLRGAGFEDARLFAEFLLSLVPASTFVQMVRTRENETELEAFWRGWKKKTEGVIVQKYSTFASFLPPRKVSDLSPLLRRPCWHVKRDMAILLDGTIPLCRDCVRREIVLGNAFDDAQGGGIAAAWAAGERWHRAHVEACRSLPPDAERGGAAKFPSPCEECDEYYTYNA